MVEPNPADPLMADIANEFKYNRNKVPSTRSRIHNKVPSTRSRIQNTVPSTRSRIHNIVV